MTRTAVLQAVNLGLCYPGQTVPSLEGVDFSLSPGRALALVGESGSGKSTCARLLTRLLTPTTGRILFQGQDVTELSSAEQVRAYRARVQMVFQDPFAALNPAHRVGHHVARPLALHRPELSPAAQKKAVEELLEAVDLDPGITLPKFPHELSGGQRQRVNLARALAVGPSVLIADEPTSMLDVSLRLSVLDTLRRLKRDRGIALLYITHDLATARAIAEDMAVLYRGKLMEAGPTDQVIDDPRHPYTRLLLAAVPDLSEPVSGADADLLADAEAIRRLSAGPGQLHQVAAGHLVRLPAAP
jgi:peptide/nickel transport system ATP-binding protein